MADAAPMPFLHHSATRTIKYPVQQLRRACHMLSFKFGSPHPTSLPSIVIDIVDNIQVPHGLTVTQLLPEPSSTFPNNPAA
ncbi:hypothetical protein PAXRUDRAFT_21491 [Paxillus rubicundulus Ve08.2h10]|uniref:Uncharacterized protein n=1 Tax=Paxillus rubicundulus Ve08.2h10 TaxID=930991 RepID=A0A0D0BMM7_9AGAM|nr:hypothetical protein PAXRUDRAFT_21491 [Paxillus rubicundulus Ve08.2h10]